MWGTGRADQSRCKDHSGTGSRDAEVSFFFEGGPEPSLRVRFGANSKDERFPQLHGDDNVLMLRCVRCGVVRLPEVGVIPFSHEVGKLHTSASTCV